MSVGSQDLAHEKHAHSGGSEDIPSEWEYLLEDGAALLAGDPAALERLTAHGKELKRMRDDIASRRPPPLKMADETVQKEWRTLLGMRPKPPGTVVDDSGAELIAERVEDSHAVSREAPFRWSQLDEDGLPRLTPASPLESFEELLADDDFCDITVGRRRGRNMPFRRRAECVVPWPYRPEEDYTDVENYVYYDLLGHAPLGDVLVEEAHGSPGDGHIQIPCWRCEGPDIVDAPTKYI